MVPGAGLEPARTNCPQDFKSCVSTNSTILAKIHYNLTKNSFCMYYQENKAAQKKGFLNNYFEFLKKNLFATNVFLC
jgi:hypothetical protein